MKKILIVDDEQRLRQIVSDFLISEGYETITAANGREALDIFFENQNIDLVILDVMMPDYDGWTVCRKIKKIANTPVIMLTARGEESDELFGFEVGADEYIKKPFSPKVLVARVNSILKRQNVATPVLFDKLEIDEAGRRVLVEGKDAELSAKDYELLSYFIRNKGIALSREAILNNVWEYDYEGDERTVDTQVKRLRAKLGECGSYIVTLRGFGYKFEVKK